MKLVINQTPFSWNLYRRTNRNNFSTGKTSNIFTVLPHITCPALGHNLIKRDLDNLFLPQNITMVYYIDNITLIGSSEQEMAITLDLLVTHIHQRMGSTAQIQEPSTSVPVLGVQWYGTSKGKGELLNLAPTTKTWLGPASLMVQRVMQAPLTSGQLWHFNSFLWQPWKIPAKENLHRRQNFGL